MHRIDYMCTNNTVIRPLMYLGDLMDELFELFNNKHNTAKHTTNGGR
jgi:hypothetical protein